MLESKNNFYFFFITILFLLVIFSKDISSWVKVSQKKELVTFTSREAKIIIEERSLIALKAIKFLNISLFQSLVHPKLGVRFSAQPYILGSDKIIHRHELRKYNDEAININWGKVNGKRLSMSFSQYYRKYIYNQDFANADQISYNDNKVLNSVIDNSDNYYKSAIVVEYKINSGLYEVNSQDWTILRLYFDKYKNDWYLVGIMNVKSVEGYYDKL
jgi:hypothetical protein